MDFDIDSFLNETFKKVEKKDKKKNDESKSNELKSPIHSDFPNKIKQSEINTQEKINSSTYNNVNLKIILIIIKNTKKGAQGLVSSLTDKSVNSNSMNKINNNLIKIQNEKKNEKLLSTKTQRILDEKKTITITNKKSNLNFNYVPFNF